MLLIDRHFLVTYGSFSLKCYLTTGGSFTENFYGLKRERAISSPPLSSTTARVPNQISQATKLRAVEVYKSLFMLVYFINILLLTADWRAVPEIET
jgi:hypothetical protein